MFRLLIVLMSFCITWTTSFSQSSGTWTGYSEYLAEDSSGSDESKLTVNRSFTIQINANGLVTGTTRVTYGKSNNSKRMNLQENVVGRFDAATNKMAVVLQPSKFLDPKSTHKVDSIYYTYTVTHVADSIVMTLQRDDKKIVDYTYFPGAKSWVVNLLPTRISIAYIKARPAPEIMPTEQVPVPGGAKDVQLPARDRDIQHTITLDTSFIRIDLYDNGEIDGDMVTLLLDGKTVARSQLLSRKSVSLSLELTKEPTEHLLEIFADNLGSIPPNTALLILTCKQKRYELNLSSNGKVNGSVKLLVRP